MQHKPTIQQVEAYLSNGNNGLGFEFVEDSPYYGLNLKCPGIISIANGPQPDTNDRIFSLLSLLSGDSFQVNIDSKTLEEFKDSHGVVTLGYQKVDIGDFWQSQGTRQNIVLCTKEVLDKLLNLVADSQKQKAAATTTPERQ